MGYWTSLARALLGRGPDDNPRPVRPRLGGPAASTYAGTGLRFTPPGAGYDHWRDVGDFRRNAVVAICVNWLSRQFLQAQLRIGRRRQDGTYEETRGPRGSEHPLVSLLARRPNPFLSARQLWAGVIADYLPYGQAFLYQARSLGGDGPPAELYWLPARRVEIRAGNEPDRPVDRYRYFNGLAWDDYPPDDVLHLRDNPDDDNPILGRGRGAEQVRSVAALNNGERYTGSVLRNAHAGKLLVPRDSSLSLDSLSGPDDDESRAAQRRRARLNLAGESAGSIDVALRPLDVLDLGLGPEQMALDRVLDRPEALVVAAFGLNCMALDLPASEHTRTYANKAEARREAWENGVIPLQDAVLDDLNHTLVPQFDPSGRLELWWDRSDVPALREDANARASRASALFQATLVDRDTARDLAGLEPLDDDDHNGSLYHGQELDGGEGEPPDDTERRKDALRQGDEPEGDDGQGPGEASDGDHIKAKGTGGRGPRTMRVLTQKGPKKKPARPGARPPKRAGNCGTGAGGFQQGNTCWRRKIRRLIKRVDELHSMLPEYAQNRRTAAVLKFKGGAIIGSGGRDLDPNQRKTKKRNEILAKLDRKHGEITVMYKARQLGLKPEALVASRPFCRNCRKALRRAGARITGPRTAVWD